MEALENAMVSGYGYEEPVPDRVCPHCGTEWYSGQEDAGLFFSASGRYCQQCLHELDTPQRRAAWLKDEQREADLLEKWVRYAPREAAEVLLGALKEQDTDALDDRILAYIMSGNESDYNEYLKEVS